MLGKQLLSTYQAADSSAISASYLPVMISAITQSVVVKLHDDISEYAPCAAIALWR